MKKILTATFAFLMIASLAAAQMHGGSGSGPMHNPIGGTNGMGMGDDDHGGNALLVAANGTIIIQSMSSDSATHSSSRTIKAVGTNGSVLWTQTLTNSRGPLELSGTNLLSVNQIVATDGTATSTITAIAIADGSTAWTKTFNGHVTDLTPFTGGTYVVVVIPAIGTGGTATRSLVAIGNDGSTLWSVTL